MTVKKTTGAIGSFFEAWRAVIRAWLKARDHRTPNDVKVDMLLGALPLHLIAAPLTRVLRAWETRIGKPGDRWSARERRDAASFVEACFDELRLAIERPPGRPRKSQGIIDAELPGAGPRPNRGLDKEARLAIPYMRGARLDAWAKRERAQRAAQGLSGTNLVELGEIIAYMKIWVEDLDRVMDVGRVPREAWEDFIAWRKLEPKFKAALKMQYSRLRRRRSALREFPPIVTLNGEHAQGW